MGARSKLNASHIQMSLFIATILGIAFGSWWVFLLGVAVLIALAIQAGDIRGPRKRF